MYCNMFQAMYVEKLFWRSLNNPSQIGVLTKYPSSFWNKKTKSRKVRKKIEMIASYEKN